jgi:DNA-directed RNA polymerase specialized sigma24 family protein
MPRKKKSNVYFTKETENAIVLYNGTTDEIKKSQIYQDKIHYAFFKLTENIIHTYKFYYTETDNIEDLQHEIIVFLLSKIHLYDQTKGTKAYSYFGTIVKRWLILNNNKNYKTQQNRTELEPLQEDINHSYELDKGNQIEKLSGLENLVELNVLSFGKNRIRSHEECI